MKYFAPRNAINLKIESLIEEILNTDYLVMGCSVNVANLGWKFEWDSAKRRFGRCTPGTKLISISYPLVKQNRDNLEVVRNVVLHEVAHAIHWTIYKKANHDSVWQNIALTIGCDGRRCYSNETVKPTKSKYSLVCPCCGKEYPKHKKPTREASCGICCPGKWDAQFRLKLIQNY
jgi:hypothetical protein